MNKSRKLKWLLTISLALCLMGGTALYASDQLDISVSINGRTLDEQGLMTDGKSYLPVRSLTGALKGIVRWDSAEGKADIYQPNVHIALFQGNNIFGNVYSGDKVTFSALVQVDTLLTNISGIKVEIFNPEGQAKVIQSKDMAEQKENFWFKTQNATYTFSEVGAYPVRVYMRPEGSDAWYLVSEKRIMSLSK